MTNMLHGYFCTPKYHLYEDDDLKFRAAKYRVRIWGAKEVIPICVVTSYDPILDPVAKNALKIARWVWESKIVYPASGLRYYEFDNDGPHPIAQGCSFDFLSGHEFRRAICGIQRRHVTVRQIEDHFGIKV